jgi:hypothetical protein
MNMDIVYDRTVDDLVIIFDPEQNADAAFEAFDQVINSLLEVYRPDILSYKTARPESEHMADIMRRITTRMSAELDALRQHANHRIVLDQLIKLTYLDNAISLCQSTRHEALRTVLTESGSVEISVDFSTVQIHRNAYQQYGYLGMLVVQFYLDILRLRRAELRTE